MGVKEGYKRTEVGVIPEDWEVLTLGEVCIKVQDGNYGESYPKANEFLDYGVPFLTSKAIGKYGFLREDLIDYISPNKHLELAKAHIESEDVLFTNRGASVGAIGFVTDKISGGNIGPQLTLLRANQEITLPSYLFHLMKSEVVQRQIINQDSGSAMNFFGIESTKKFLLPIPIKTEQKAIATALSDIDGLINSLTKLIEKKKNIKQGTMQELLTGKKRLDGFSGEWVEKNLGEIADVVSGGTPKTSDSSYWGGTIPWLTVADFNTGFRWVRDAEKAITEKGFNESPTQMLLHGDIIISARGTVGVVAQIAIPMVFNQSCYGLRAKSGIAHNDYVYYSLIQSLESFQQLAYGGVFSTITRDSFKNIIIILPPLSEQKAIATILSDMDSEIENLQAKLDKYIAIKQGMMQELLTGRIRLLEGA